MVGGVVLFRALDEQVELGIADVEHRAHLQDEQDTGRGQDRGEVHVADQLEASGAVDLRRLIQRGIHRTQRGQIDDAVPAAMLPDLGDPVDGGDGRGAAQQALIAEQLTDEAVIRIQEDVEHRDDDHRGDEVGHVGDGLHEALDLGRTDLVDQQRQDDREDEAGHQRPQADAERVPQDLAEERRGEGLFEVVQTDPFAAGQALGRVELAERQLDAPHRHVGEDRHEYQSRSGKHPQLPVALEVVGEAFEPTRLAALDASGGGRRPRPSRNGVCSCWSPYRS